MWHVNEMANILKSYAIQNSYDCFKNRRIAAALCSDLLSSFDECRIITMLFREGLGECMRNAPYTNAYDKSLAKDRVKVFVKKLGFNDTVIDNVVNFVGILTDAKTAFRYMSILEILDRQREQARMFEREKKKRIFAKKEADFNSKIYSEVEALFIDFSYKGKTIPSLKSFVALKKFSNYMPLPWSKVSEINMQNLSELYFCNADPDSDIRITAPILEKLTIRCDTAYKKIQQSPHLEINAGKLKELKICMPGYKISLIGNLENLECLCISNTELTDLSWLKGCKKLKKLHIYSKIQDIGDIPEIESLQELDLESAGIENIEDIKLFPNLQVLSLKYNKIHTIKKIDNLQHIKRINLLGNPITETNEIGELENPELILSYVDNEIYKFDKKIEDVFFRAYLSYSSREKNIKKLTPDMKRYWMEKSDEEKYAEFVNNIFAESFYSHNPTSLIFANIFCSYNPTSSVMDYDTRIKRQYLEFVKEQFPFIEIKEDFEKQIQREYFGIAHFYKSEPGNVLYVNRSIYSIRVKYESGAGVEMNFINTGNHALKDSDVKKLIKENCSYIDLSQIKVTITIFDLYRISNLEGIEVGILAALYSLENQIRLPVSTFVAGEYKKSGSFKKLEVTSTINQIGKLQGANRIVFFTSGKHETIENAGVRVEYRNTMSDLQSCIN